jgi:TonB family protein
MNGFFIHSVKAGCFMAIFYLVYYLFLSRDTAYVRNRIYLLSSVLLSWLLPLIRLKTELPVVNTEAIQWLLIEMLGQPDATAADSAVTVAGKPDFLRLVSLIWIAGIVFFGARFVSGIARIIRMIMTGRVSGNIVFIDRMKHFSGFSAMGFIFINNDLADHEKEKIILHEEIHNRSLHFLDIILFEITLALQWMNPFAYLTRYSVRALHEYHTDREYINRTGKIADYQKMIFNEIFGTRDIPIASCFSTKSLIKKRILMMKRNQTRPGAAMKIAIALPLIAATVIMFSCRDELETSLSSIQPPDSVMEIPTEIMVFNPGDTIGTTLIVLPARLESVKDSLREARLAFARSVQVSNAPTRVATEDMIIIVDDKERTPEYLKTINPSEIASLDVLKGEKATAKYGSKGTAGVIEIITRKYVAESQPEFSGDDIFMIVEDMPTFDGGDVQKFSNWVKERVRYPQIAIENGIQGKVFIGFVVEKDGTVSTVQVLRSVDKSNDDEAVRVVLSSPKWKPGYQRGQPVRVRFSITVNFALN